MLIPKPKARYSSATGRIVIKNHMQAHRRNIELARRQVEVYRLVYKKFSIWSSAISEIDAAKIDEIGMLVASEIQYRLLDNLSNWKNVYNQAEKLDPLTFDLEAFALGATRYGFQARLLRLARDWEVLTWEARLRQYVESKPCDHYLIGSGDETPE
jgi:hypothetical protein